MINPPSLADFRAKFPDMSGISDAIVTDALASASRRIGSDWADDDKEPAALLLAAHILTIEGYFGSTIVEGRSITSRKVGDVSVTFDKASKTGLSETVFGRSFRDYSRRNAPIGVTVAS